MIIIYITETVIRKCKVDVVIFHYYCWRDLCSSAELVSVAASSGQCKTARPSLKHDFLCCYIAVINACPSPPKTFLFLIQVFVLFQNIFCIQDLNRPSSWSKTGFVAGRAPNPPKYAVFCGPQHSTAWPVQVKPPWLCSGPQGLREPRWSGGVVATFKVTTWSRPLGLHRG